MSNHRIWLERNLRNRQQSSPLSTKLPCSKLGLELSNRIRNGEGKVRTVEKKIEALEEGRKGGVKAREKLVIAILENMIKLLNLHL
jgi:hypothetical protein